MRVCYATGSGLGSPFAPHGLRTDSIVCELYLVTICLRHGLAKDLIELQFTGPAFATFEQLRHAAADIKYTKQPACTCSQLSAVVADTLQWYWNEPSSPQSRYTIGTVQGWVNCSGTGCSMGCSMHVHAACSSFTGMGTVIPAQTEKGAVNHYHQTFFTNPTQG